MSTASILIGENKETNVTSNSRTGPAAQGKSGPRYRETRQSRSAASEARFLRAAEQVFRKHGYSAGSAAEIIERSGLSTGSFYHRFGDKRQLLYVMVERFRERVVLLLEKEGPGQKDYPDLNSMLNAFASLTYDMVSGSLGMYRAVMELSHKEPEIGGILRALTAEIVQQIAKSAPSFADEITAEDVDISLMQAIQLIVTIIVQTLLGNGPGFPQDRDRLVALCVAATQGLLRPDRP